MHIKIRNDTGDYFIEYKDSTGKRRRRAIKMANLNEWIDIPIIYLLAFDEECIYVGQTTNFLSRMMTHLKNSKILKKRFTHIYYFKTKKEEINEMEKLLIKSLKPRYNSKI